MKKLLFSLAMLALVFTACQNETNVEDPNAVEVTLSVSAPELATRALGANTNSRMGGVTNVDWDLYDLRYILSIYDDAGNNLLQDPQTFITTACYSDATFTLRLSPERTYKFVLWADFIAEGTNADLHYNTADMKNIDLKDEAVYDESRDAYFASENHFISENGLQTTVVLRRPFGKLRLVTGDMKYVAKGTAPKSAKVAYEYDRPSSFDAVVGVTNTAVYTKKEFTFNIDTARYKMGLDASTDSCTLFVDYIYAPKDTTQEFATPFEFFVYDDVMTNQTTTTLMRHVKLNTQIPVKRNRITTLAGSVLTRESTLTIKIDEIFVNDTTIIY